MNGSKPRRKRGLRRRLWRDHWEWQSGNDARLLVDGECYFPVMLEAIDAARQSLLLEFYLAKSGRVMERFLDALIRAARRQVRVCVLLDAFGSQGLKAQDRLLLREAGAELVFYNPVALRKGVRNFSRDHRKLLVADGQTAFIGGTGLTDEFLHGKGGELPWHEMMLQVSGPVVRDWQQLFQRQWRLSGGQRLVLPDGGEQIGRVQMKVATTHGLRRQEIKANFRRHINGAEHRVWLVTAYFLPSWSIRRALRRAAERGVDVRLLLPGLKTDHPSVYYAARRFYKPLLSAGVRIFEYQPRFIHAKVGVCDDWLSLGSCNLDHWNLRWNLEANQEVMDPELTAEVCAVIESGIGDSEEVTLASWMARPWYQRFWSFCLGLAHGLAQRLV